MKEQNMRPVVVIRLDDTVRTVPRIGSVPRLDTVWISREGRSLTARHERTGDTGVSAHAERRWEPFNASAVADWVVAVCDADPLAVVCVVGANRHVPLVTALTSRFDRDHVLIFDDDVHDSAVLRLENGAAKIGVTTSVLAEGWSRRHLVAAALVDVDAPGEVEAFAADVQPSPTEPPSDGNVLLVSYFGRPSSPVSVHRLGYWLDHLADVGAELGAELRPRWLTATRQASGSDGMIHVADPGDHRFDLQEDDTLNAMRRLGLSTIGAAWELAVRRVVDQWTHRFDHVVISVGPFGYLGLAEYFSERWGANVIIDFRDPMAGDTRLRYTTDQREWLARHERAMVRHASSIVSVNEACLDRIAPDVEVPRAVVANGFDERLAAGIERAPTAPSGRSGHDGIRLVYTGTIFRELPLDRVVDALDPARHELVHFGRDNSEHHVVGVLAGTRSGGFISDQRELLSNVAAADLGIVRTSGEATTQTTKIFDYLAAGVEILIVTDGEPGTGALHELTADVDGVHWVRNETAALVDFFERYVPNRPADERADRFTRRHQTMGLIRQMLDPDEPRAASQVEVGPGLIDEDPAARAATLEHDVVELRSQVDELRAELDRVSRGHASNARSIRGHAALIDRLDKGLERSRIDRQLRSIPSTGLARVRRRLRVPDQTPRRVSTDDSGPKTSATVLVVAGAYPVGRGTYGGQPIARRVVRYRQAGYQVTVFVPTNDPQIRESIDASGTRVVFGQITALPGLAHGVRPDVLAVHSPQPGWWDAVSGLASDVKTVMWMHGFESRDWRALLFDYTAAEIEQRGPRLDALNAERRQFLGEVFSDGDIDVVFVSDFMRRTAEEFVGRTAVSGHVIHNVIDIDQFPYRSRGAGDRLRVVSVRSFAKRNYGTDLLAKTVADLRSHRRFDELEFTVVGTGRHFAADTRSMRELDNVVLREQVLGPDELAEALSSHGIALLPTRWDSQGMIVGEAMSTGAVPVVNGVTAIPEFVDPDVAGVAAGDDHHGLASAIAEMLDDEDLFLARSAAARDRVVAQCGPEVTVRLELDLFDKVLL